MKRLELVQRINQIMKSHIIKIMNSLTQGRLNNLVNIQKEKLPIIMQSKKR